MAFPSRSVFGRGPFGRQRFGGAATRPTVEVEQDLYSLDVRDGSNNIEAWLPNWISGQHTEAVNQPSILEFQYPYGDEHISRLDNPNLIGLFDQTGTLIDRLRIVKTRKIRADGKLILYVKARGLLAQLGQEVLASDYTATSTSVTTIVKNLLAEQTITNLAHVKGRKIAGAIGSTSTSLSVKAGESILTGLHRLQNIVGGMFYVNAHGQFRWVRDFKKTHQWLQVGHNLPGLEVEYDYESIKTRVIAYGQGATPATRASATANNTSAQSTYGIRVHLISMPTISDTDILQARADEAVRLLSKPRKYIKAPVVDLSLSCQERLDYSHEAVKCGRRVLIVDGDIDETIMSRYLKVQRDLASPVSVTVDLQDSRDIAQDAAGFGDGTSDALQTILKPNLEFSDVIAGLLKKVDDITTLDTGNLDQDTLWDTTAHSGVLDDMLDDLLTTDIDTVIDAIEANAAAKNDIADAIRDDLIDAIEANAAAKNDIADAIRDDLIDAIEANAAAIQDIADALIGDPTAIAALDAAIGGSDISTDNPQAVAVVGSVAPGSTGEVADAGHVHGVISAATPQALGTAAPGTTGTVSDAGHIHAMPVYT